jgi:hypothetical protein
LFVIKKLDELLAAIFAMSSLKTESTLINLTRKIRVLFAALPAVIFHLAVIAPMLVAYPLGPLHKSPGFLRLLIMLINPFSHLRVDLIFFG